MKNRDTYTKVLTRFDNIFKIAKQKNSKNASKLNRPINLLNDTITLAQQPAENDQHQIYMILLMLSK